MGGDGIVVRHMERTFINFTTNASGNAYQAAAIDPGNATTFPWLGQFALNYAQYRWRKFVIRYVPRVGTGSNGEVAVGIVFDSAAPTPTTLAQVISCMGSVGPVCHELAVAVDCSAFSMPWYYITPTSGTVERPFTVVGAVEGAPATTNVGTLSIEYEIELRHACASALNP